MAFVQNQPNQTPYRPSRLFKRIPQPNVGSGQEQSTVYEGFYGEMPMPATQFATSVTALQSLDDAPSVATAMSNASVVQRTNRRNGMVATGGLQEYETPTPQMNNPVYTSKFQPELIGPHVNYYQNNGWYIAYPAASVMQGGMRNQMLSTRVDQLTTRTTGGPGPGSMRQAPRFKAVQTIPRYSTMPPSYPTSSANG